MEGDRTGDFNRFGVHRAKHAPDGIDDPKRYGLREILIVNGIVECCGEFCDASRK